MFKHEKQLLKDVRVDKPNPNYANMMQEQLGGAHGELKAAMQYASQSFRIKDQRIKDLFLDIAAEELSHMEMVATLVNLLNGHQVDAAGTTAGSIQASVQSGLTPMLTNASGYPWTGAYMEDTGDLAADIISNISAEQRAKVVYQYLYRQVNDSGVREAIDFLLNREEAHNTLFRRPSTCWRRRAPWLTGASPRTPSNISTSRRRVSSSTRTTSRIRSRRNSTSRTRARISRTSSQWGRGKKSLPLTRRTRCGRVDPAHTYIDR